MTRIIKFTRELATVLTWLAVSAGALALLIKALEFILAGGCDA
jgi:hypothetical protein